MKTVRIPGNMAPWRCRINGVDYEYPAGEIREVPDAVAAVIATYNAAQRATAEAAQDKRYTLEDGTLRVRLGGEIELAATVIDDTSAQALYAGGLTQANTEIKRVIAMTATAEKVLTLGSVTKTEHGVVFGYSGEDKANIKSMRVYAINTDKDFDLDLNAVKKLADRVAALETKVAALEAAGGST